MIDILAAVPERVLDERITTLFAKFGANNVFSVVDGAMALGISIDEGWRILYSQQIEDSRYRVAIYNGRLWLLAQNPFFHAAHAWAVQYGGALRGLPAPFSASDFSQATGIPYSASNTILSILVQYGLMENESTQDGSAATFRLPRRKIRRAA